MKGSDRKAAGTDTMGPIAVAALTVGGICFLVLMLVLVLGVFYGKLDGRSLLTLPVILVVSIVVVAVFDESETPLKKLNRLKGEASEERQRFLADREQDESAALARLQFSSEDHCPKGWEVVRHLWVVRCVADYPSDANGRLGLKAISIGGNALIERNFAIIHSPDRLPAGLDRADELRSFEEQLSRTSDGAIKVEKVWRGPVKVWEAMAVDAREIDALAHAPAAPPAQQADPARQPDPAPPAHMADRPPTQSPMTALDPEHDTLVIDGNNLLRETCDPLDGEVKFDTAVLKTIADHLEQRGFDYHVFFDANIHWLLLDRRADDEEIAAITGFPRRKLTRVPRDHEADTFILDYAREQSAVILSNDYFGKYRATYDFLDDPSRKTGFTRSGPLVLIPRLASIRI